MKKKIIGLMLLLSFSASTGNVGAYLGMTYGFLDSSGLGELNSEQLASFDIAIL